MLRKMGIVLAVVAVGMTAIQTDAFARGGGHGGGGFHSDRSAGGRWRGYADRDWSCDWPYYGYYRYYGYCE